MSDLLNKFDAALKTGTVSPQLTALLRGTLPAEEVAINTKIVAQLDAPPSVTYGVSASEIPSPPARLGAARSALALADAYESDPEVARLVDSLERACLAAVGDLEMRATCLRAIAQLSPRLPAANAARLAEFAEAEVRGTLSGHGGALSILPWFSPHLSPQAVGLVATAIHVECATYPRLPQMTVGALLHFQSVMSMVAAIRPNFLRAEVVYRHLLGKAIEEIVGRHADDFRDASSPQREVAINSFEWGCYAAGFLDLGTERTFLEQNVPRVKRGMPVAWNLATKGVLAEDVPEILRILGLILEDLKRIELTGDRTLLFRAFRPIIQTAQAYRGRVNGELRKLFAAMLPLAPVPELAYHLMIALRTVGE